MVYRERLRAPFAWWVIGLLLGVTTVTAVGFILGPWMSLAAGLVALIGISAFLFWVGGTVLEVSGEGVRVGRSLLEWSYTGDVTVLDDAATQNLLGRDADTRAFVVQRPWLRRAVRIDVDDPADPHPYWVVSSRSPAQCAAAVERARQGRVTS